MKLDFSTLQNAVQSLKAALLRADAAPQDEIIRDGVIQRFEYTYELCLKMLRRQLGQESANPEAIDALSFKELLREALEKGIALDLKLWTEFREQRNISAHTYDLKKAQSVYQSAKIFLRHAENLLAELLKRPHD